MSNGNSPSAPGCSFHLELSGGFLLLLSITGFLCGTQALFAAALAAAVHELGHLALILCQGSVPGSMRLDASGASLRCLGPVPTVREELVRALAGPAAGLGMWVLLRGSASVFLHMSAGMSLMLSLVNLLPAPGLDGGRVLDCLMSGAAEADRWLRLAPWLGFFSALLTLLLGIFRSPQLFLYGVWLFLRQVKVRLRD